ncbi:MAG TPA: SDR family oxidoreductase [Candidatus Lokiarchaeia archaeon]|nr:SDR family oxidoreductase [Candidatus Lokiarchaeia archaeon]
MSISVKNKVICITGSSIGIGREDAFSFAKEGAIIVITFNTNQTEAEKVAKQCMKLGASGTFVLQLNVMDDSSIKNAVKTIVAKYKHIDILINNAGVILWKHLEDQTSEEIELQTRTNLEGLIKMTKECLPHVKEMIINMASAAGLEGYENITTYCATKWGVRGFTKAIANETPLKVFSVNPGVIATQMNNFKGMPPEKVAKVILNLAKGKYNLDSGSDVNIWDYVE